MIDVVISPHGRPATELLEQVVTDAQRRGPLAPVTVVVPSNFAGLVARRLLGRGVRGRGGIANVNFVTPFRLAELVAVGQLSGKRPLTNPVLGAAVRQTLANDPGPFARVRDHQATEQAVAAAVGELSNVSRQGRDAIIAASGFAAGVVQVHDRVMQQLRGFHDEAGLARAAAHRADLTTALTPFGHVIWYLPGPISAPLGSFLRAVFAHVDTTVIVGASGSAEADAEVYRALRLAGVDQGGAAVAGEGGDAQVSAPLASHVVSVTDADEEVRHVVREVIALADAGVALDRIGIFHPVPDPYVRILEQQFRAAGIAANGPSRRRLADSIAGRVLTGALALPSERWRRDRVMALVSSGPVLHDDEVVRPTRWENLSREAGVVADRRDWIAKLGAHHERLGRQADEAAAQGRSVWAERLAADRAETEVLRSFVETVGASVDAVLRSGSWQQRGAAALALLHTLLGPAHRHQWWPEGEQVAFERVEAVLERLAALDEIDPDPSSTVFVRALGTELSIARERSGRFGTGVVYGPLSSAAGHDLDAVFVLGCAEGLLPAPRREDALLPDRARQLTGGDLPARLGQLHEQHRMFLAALAAAPADRRWLLFPRGDLRSGRRARPSRWLLPSASKLANKTLFATAFDHETPAGLTTIESHARGIADADHAGSIDERDLAEVLAHVARSGRAVDHPAVDGVRRGLVAQESRRGGSFTAFDGNLGDEPLPAMHDVLWSASRLETWATCGFRYFLRHVLDLEDRDDPERTIELSALDRGSALHEVLDRFMSEMVHAGPPKPSEPWSDEQRDRARQIAHEVFGDYDGRGRTGRPVLWGTQQRDLVASLDEFLDADDRHRAARRAVPAQLEFGFGSRGVPPVEIAIDANRRLRFRGFIDRVDAVEADPASSERRGPRMIVSDYKTGSGTQYKRLEGDDDPTRSGTLLQLGLYAEAALQLLGAASVDTRYWMVNPRANYQRYGYEWSDPQRSRLTEVVGTIVDGIESGVFAAAPGDWDSFRRTYAECAFCEFDRVCPRDRAEHAAEKADDPHLAVRVALTSRPEAGADR